MNCTLHEVSVDPYFTILMRIPKKMTAIEFKGLTIKAESFFKVSSIPNAAPQKKKPFFWTKEEKTQLAQYVKDGLNFKEIAKRIGRPESSVYNQIKNAKKVQA